MILLLSKENTATFMRKALQISYCMDYGTFCTVMHNRVQDYYSKEKFGTMQRSFTRWFCDLDSYKAEMFTAYVLTQMEK